MMFRFGSNNTCGEFVLFVHFDNQPTYNTGYDLALGKFVKLLPNLVEYLLFGNLVSPKFNQSAEC